MEKNLTTVTGIIVFQGQDIFKVALAPDKIVLGRLSGTLRKALTDPSEFPVVGDYVKGDLFADNQLLLQTLLPRRSFLQRKVAGTQSHAQGIAANVDTVFIATSCNQEFNLKRLERFVTIVWDSGATPVFVLTKKDLTTPALVAEKVQTLTDYFYGLPVITTSSTEDNREKFLPYLGAGQLVTLIGSSGVGKSTLLNQFLTPQRQQVTKEIRLDDAHGKHSTTARQLFFLAGGGMIIDTPGMREIGLDTVRASSLEKVFAQITQLSTECRFKDCQHQSEPGCAVKAALDSGALSTEQFANYRKMQAQLAYLKRKEAKKNKN